MSSIINALRNARVCYGWLTVLFTVISIGFFLVGGFGYGRMAVGVGFGVAAFFVSLLWLDEFEKDLFNSQLTHNKY